MVSNDQLKSLMVIYFLMGTIMLVPFMYDIDMHCKGHWFQKTLVSVLIVAVSPIFLGLSFTAWVLRSLRDGE
jgi:hypothetical protein